MVCSSRSFLARVVWTQPWHVMPALISLHHRQQEVSSVWSSALPLSPPWDRTSHFSPPSLPASWPPLSVSQILQGGFSAFQVCLAASWSCSRRPSPPQDRGQHHWLHFPCGASMLGGLMFWLWAEETSGNTRDRAVAVLILCALLSGSLKSEQDDSTHGYSILPCLGWRWGDGAYLSSLVLSSFLL